MAKMDSLTLRQKYVEFLKKHEHVHVPSFPLIPKEDATTLLVSSGMQPLMPYLLGEKHPQGGRLVDSQMCLRATGFLDDTNEVGNNRHTTAFEMLGNWSLGTYFKKEQLSYFFELLTDEIGLDPHKLYVTVFNGDEKINIPKDVESVEIWKELFKKKGIEAKDVELITEENGAKKGMQGGRIFYYGAKKNWWSRNGVPENMPANEPGGPDSEVFYEFTSVSHNEKFGKHCHPNCDCGRFLELGNSVFMQYQKQANGVFKELPQKNVDFGGGLERTLAALSDNPDIFLTDMYFPIINEIEKMSGRAYQEDLNKPPMRIIVDHLKAACFLMVNGVTPSNKLQGYILRRFLRRAAVKMYALTGDVSKISENFVKLCNEFVDYYSKVSLNFGFGFEKPHVKEFISKNVKDEIEKFSLGLTRGLREVSKYKKEEVNGLNVFNLFQSYGYPYELAVEILKERFPDVVIDRSDFDNAYEGHKKLSKLASDKIFKGGLGGMSDIFKKYHTATHLLHQALRDVLGDLVTQKGSNITEERLRFDFSFGRKMTPEEIKKVEDIVNEKISENLAVNVLELPIKEAEKTGALHFFGEKYADVVKVYYIGKSLETAYSKEFCGGPHVSNTAELGKFSIIKEEAVSQGIRRLKAVLS